jgi:hypothetical protein
MADRQVDRYTDSEGGKTTYVGSEKTAGDAAAATARAKYDPSMKKPDASSLDDAPVSPLGLAAQREAARKKAAAAGGATNARAAVVKKMLKKGEGADTEQ